ncbi:helix-turn-helix domain-containing protein [Teredinibacter turnerae]|uniref:helix-turn-helix domain-containing protein n=1 Tax=Teredinibacter turnerae TaxID=2426 RepID=UPI00035F8C98|nr:helix-turn-helix transcriptional regulator [Teredinibacter turnerae]
MVKVHLSRLMGERKLRIVDVARDTGINRGTIARLYHETAIRIDFDVLEKLCTYMECSVGELVELQPSKETHNLERNTKK